MKRFISFSGGVESTTMCLLYGKGATAIWCDTGAEHELMYQRIDEMEAFFKQYHNGEFELLRIHATVNHKKEKYSSLTSLAVAYSYMPSGQQRYCTKYFKIQPIDNFLSKQGDCELMIGFNYDEAGRTGSLEAKPNVIYTYPLLEDGYTRQDCVDMLNREDIAPHFPVYMLRGGCKMCFFKSRREYKALYHLNRSEFDEVLHFEESIQDKRKKFYSIMGNEMSLRQLAVECEREQQFLVEQDWQELYKSLRTETSCGAFCHR